MGKELDPEDIEVIPTTSDPKAPFDIGCVTNKGDRDRVLLSKVLGTIPRHTVNGTYPVEVKINDPGGGQGSDLSLAFFFSDGEQITSPTKVVSWSP